jgi:hypothetical protein
MPHYGAALNTSLLLEEPLLAALPPPACGSMISETRGGVMCTSAVVSLLRCLAICKHEFCYKMLGICDRVTCVLAMSALRGGRPSSFSMQAAAASVFICMLP